MSILIHGPIDFGRSPAVKRVEETKSIRNNWGNSLFGGGNMVFAN